LKLVRKHYSRRDRRILRLVEEQGTAEGRSPWEVLENRRGGFLAWHKSVLVTALRGHSKSEVVPREEEGTTGRRRKGKNGKN